MATEFDEDVRQIAESAARLGIELDEDAAHLWLAAMAAAQSDEGDDVVLDEESHTFGHRVSMLDFSPKDLERFRRIGAIVEVTGPEGIAESALALSGSAAQSKIQTYPGDCDYFQRLNLRTDTREEACALMAQLMRHKVLATSQGDTFQFMEAKFGNYPLDGTHRGASHFAGTPISWTLEEVEAGRITMYTHGDEPVEIAWDDVAHDPGWCKLDWVVADPDRRGLSAASNVIDVTWESPSGDIVPLDGYLDAYFQEVYLDSDAMPVFAKVAQHVSDDALDDYVERLEAEVAKYLTTSVNYGKAAKRMYNIFRLSGRHVDAAFVRELFNEPATLLYQVWSLLGTLDDAARPGSSVDLEQIRDEADNLILRVVEVLEGPEEVEIVAALLRLRRSLEAHRIDEVRAADLQAAESQIINVVNTFFQDKLMARPAIREYIERIQTGSVTTV